MTVAKLLTVVEDNKPQPRLSANLLLKKLIGNRLCLGLLRFLMIHPDGRFSKLAIVHALDESGTGPEIESAMAVLVSTGLVNTDAESGTCCYLLTRNVPIRHLVINLAEFDWHQCQRLDHYRVNNHRMPDKN